MFVHNVLYAGYRDTVGFKIDGKNSLWEHEIIFFSVWHIRVFLWRKLLLIYAVNCFNRRLNKQTNKNKEINKENRKKSSDQTRIKPGNIQPSVSAAEQTSASFCYTWKITVDSIEKAFFCEGHIFASSHATKFCFLEVLALAWKYSILATTFCWHKLLSCERWVKIIFSTCPPSQADSSKTNVLEKVIFWKSN